MTLNHTTGDMIIGPPDYDAQDMNDFYEAQERRAMKRYFFDTDQDGHWYLVEEEHHAKWDLWVNLDQDTEAAWTHPEFAKPIGSHPSLLTFTDPK